jgi:hypothetical protein
VKPPLQLAIHRVEELDTSIKGTIAGGGVILHIQNPSSTSFQRRTKGAGFLVSVDPMPKRVGEFFMHD